MSTLMALRDTIIGHDVRIGHGALILPGAEVGHGAVIGAGAVVAGRVAPDRIVAGNPARMIRPRFPPQVAAGLLHPAWWNWPSDRIDAAVPYLMSGDVSALAGLASG